MIDRIMRRIARRPRPNHYIVTRRDRLAVYDFGSTVTIAVGSSRRWRIMYEFKDVR